MAAEIIIDTDLQKQFADKLYSNKEFYRAITEYHRLLHFFPKEKKIEIHLQIIRSYLAGLNYNGAIVYIENLKTNSIDIFQNTSVKFLYSVALFELDNHRIFTYRKETIELALKQLDDISADFVPNSRSTINNFLEDWEKGSQKLTKKNPWLAGSLSAVIPGSGSLYNQRYKEGIYSFLITGLFVAASIEARKKEQNTQEAIFSFFALAFYGGNIYTAINGAYKHNEYKKSNYLKQLRVGYNINFQY